MSENNFAASTELSKLEAQGAGHDSSVPSSGAAHSAITGPAPDATLLASILESLPEPILVTREDSIIYINHEFTRLFGFTPQDLLGQSPRAFTQHASRLGSNHAEEHSLLRQQVEARGRATIEAIRFTRSGHPVDVAVTCAPLLRDGHTLGHIYTYRDICDQKQHTARLQHGALHDSLTGLPNRALFLDRLKLAMARRSRRNEQGCGVIFLDVDKFKEINDSRGHSTGDALLIEIARRLSATIRPQDTAARLSGDEFALLLDQVSTIEDMSVVARRVQTELGRPFDLSGQTVQTGASLGVALCGSEHQAPEQLLRDADFAMYRAKQQGGHRFEIFDRYMRVHISSHQKRERELRRVLDKREFAIFYQPFYSLDDGKLQGFEALLRLNRGDGTFESFQAMLETAESAGLSVTLNRETLVEACRQLRVWSAAWPKSSFTLSVNLSARQFYHPEMINLVSAVLSRSSVDPRRLLFEIPETALNESPETAAALLARLSELGIRLAIDRFGGGTAPVNQLLQLPIDLVKFDPSLTAAASGGGRAGTVLASLIQMSSSLGITTLAQGVEHDHQHEALRQMGCHFVQGFLFAPAVASETATTMIGEGRWTASSTLTPAALHRPLATSITAQPTFGLD